ncbi:MULTISPECIES: non-homologous end-joining DNA ligase [Rhodococcus]|uniref:non-homologous end-joining DNA ligase n=1 Tax=Rhodococcus TaxID=1827 RepID=UPI0007CD9136|nr:MULTISPECIES: non-homologous end-joining DNA ligase [Rhodococcus]MBX4167690.1 non-homologous end-joining DNA ligase [Rhodococcus sp. DMU2021]QXF80185.1 ATP-dependent DNA ligase [Rhodococcus pyridinivorans]
MPSTTTELSPMLATLGPPPTGNWAFEMKWDGQRTLATVTDGQCRLTSRTGNDITRSFPELPHLLTTATGGRDCIVDGEIVTLDSEGRPSFARLQRRMHVHRPTEELRAELPVLIYLFDVLALDGESTTELSYRQRRAVLDDLIVPGPRVQLSPYWTDVDAPTMLTVAREHGLEGIVAKDPDAPYLPGTRSDGWIKTPLRRNTEVVVVGWLPGSGKAAGGIGSLLLGAHDDEERLVFIGRVGTGFTAATRRELRSQLRPLERPTTPLAVAPPARETHGAHWVEPILVGEVEYREYAGGSLRHPSWRGLRTDKTVPEVDLPGRH